MTIPATLSTEEAIARPWEAVVVGAGPAGALAAHRLAQAGVRVLLVDRASFPRWKVCGCCLSNGALHTLRSAGLGDLAERQGAVPLGRACLASGPRQALLPLPEGAALSREAFDAALVESAVEAGAVFLPQTLARALPPDNAEDRPLLLRCNGREQTARTRLVLVADGLGGRVLTGEPGCAPVAAVGSRLGAGAAAPGAPAFFAPGTIYMACGTGGYVGLVRLEDGRLDVAAALDAWLVHKHAGVGRAVAAILGGVDWPAVPGLIELAWRGTPTLTRRRPRLAGHRFFMLGDAAGYVEPFTGEGMAWALTSAVAVTPLAVAAVRQWRPDLARRWQVLHRHLFEPRRRLCRLVTGLLRLPWLMRGVVEVLARAPFLAAPLVGRLQR
jgi:flavin-dependent dehydrogenase